MESACLGRILLVGDGDFSFSLSLAKHAEFFPGQVTTSNLESPESIQQHQLAQDNMVQLKDMGVCVLLEVDARDLHNHPSIGCTVYDRVIFNFPLADRHNIKKNRALLVDFFTSCSSILAPQGQVMVTLCKGQGGTPADQPQRSWHDSWQVQAMAANAGFVLCDVLPFEVSKFPEYHSVGFRFQDKSFNTGNSLTHVFEKTETVTVPDEVNPRGMLSIEDSSYSCSNYLTERLNRNLLEEDTSPIYLVKSKLETVLAECFSSRIVPSSHLPSVLAGYKSLASFTLGSDVSGEGDALTESKRRKDRDNLSLKQESQTMISFAHNIESVKRDTNNLQNRETNSVLVGLVSKVEEAVYVLIKNSAFCAGAQSESGDAGSGSGDSQGAPSVCDRGYEMRGVTEIGIEVSDQIVVDGTSKGSAKVFHHRTSLLENLDNVCADCFVNVCVSDSAGDHTASTSVGQFDRSSCPVNSILVSGQCCWPCPIQQSCLPVHHQLMFVCRDACVSSQVLSEKLVLCLHESGLFVEETEIVIKPPVDNESPKVCVHGFDAVEAVNIIQVKRMHKSEGLSHTQEIGVLLDVTHCSARYQVALFHIDNFACFLYKLPNVRILWSTGEKVLQQFVSLQTSTSSSVGGRPLRSQYFSPISMYPMRYTHDISFWEQQSDASMTLHFDESEFMDIVRYCAGDVVVDVTLVDMYTEPAGTLGRTSRCYRLQFLSHDQTFPYTVSWKLQSQIRVELSRRMGIVLR